MATVNVFWDVQNEVVPNASTYNAFSIELKKADGNTVATATEPLDADAHTFLNVGAGDYVVSVATVDGQGNPAADPVSAPFAVPAEPTAPIAVGVSVNLA